MRTRKFWIDAGERAVRTTAQAAVAFIGANAVGITDVDWTQAASVSGLAGVLSLLMSIAASGDGTDTASFVNDKEH